uniref:Uncharacterized protein LOC102802866 n=1 Tax=Saccoglossus kowalevskii TaxID=10224 RepID=A0ABM0MGW1_SACKO|nr:PREDICTED: uncharacterized protein LOC102802866 [Saccoglossus kowalevskii]
MLCRSKCVHTLAVVCTADAYASKALLKVEDQYPIIRQQPQKIIAKSKQSLKRAVCSTGERILKTTPGRLLLRSLESTIDASERVLDYLLPEEKSKCETTEKVAAQGGELTTTIKGTQTEEVKVKGYLQIVGAPFRFAGMLIAAPLQLWTDVLRKVYNFLLLSSRRSRRRRSRKSGACSPKTISNRMKKTPRKRLTPVSFVEHFTRHFALPSKALHLFGIETKRSGSDGDIRRYLVASPSAKDDSPMFPHDADKKRKLDETLTDTDSSDFDLEDYRSSQDEDYVPSNTDSGSDDYSSHENKDDDETAKVEAAAELEALCKDRDEILEGETIGKSRRVKVTTNEDGCTHNKSKILSASPEILPTLHLMAPDRIQVTATKSIAHSPVINLRPQWSCRPSHL